MAKKDLSKAKKFIKPNAIVVNDGTSDYVLDNVIRDTTSIAQDDAETTDIECETSDSPIYTATTLGKYQFTAEVGDVQDDLLVALLGFTKDDTSGVIYAPKSYSNKYVSVAVCYKNPDAENYTAFVLPKLQLNSKMTIESLNTNLARITFSGTAQDGDVKGVSGVTSPFYVDTKYTLPE